jgi:SAM-dependent methyltransferase
MASIRAVEVRPLAPGPDGNYNSWDMRRRRAGEALLPWIEQTVPLDGKTVLEYGCGAGSVSCAVAARAQKLIGLDIDSALVEVGTIRAAEMGLDNVELVVHPVDEIFEALRARKGDVDVLLLYAVLEHMTVSERLTLLSIAREVVASDGAIVVCETPNRLTYFDFHTAQIPFFQMLPDDLAVEYYRSSSRVDFTASLDEAATRGRPAALDALARWGRGVSFHEFEVTFGDLSKHVLASSHDVLLFGERPVLSEEVALSRYMQRSRPDLDGSWSRSWLDVILSPDPFAERPPVLRPWIVDASGGLAVGWNSTDSLLMHGAQATLPISLPTPTSTVVLGTATQDGHVATLSLIPDAGVPIAVSHRSEPWVTTYTTISLDDPVQNLTLRTDSDCQIAFIGYEAA